ncbi:F-box/kelch-repeat protein At3g06240-like [Cornus florida]|uniref:F-box/kelch-repeat protein At3g06240-like n=1 Tax=Cornus florida TaxID=4283 RepID=UPI00289FA7A4|nr:F-box/kelch-repeat protein At3g06240-like [Cornus florida]
METETRHSQTTESQRLPDDLLCNILSRLPVLNLMQYRCVSKSWQSMISDPQFIKTHLHQSTQSLDTQRLMVTHPFNGYFISLDYESCHESKWVVSPWKSSYSYAEVLCSCDGLFLLRLHYKPFRSPNKTSNKEFVLWNPSIRKYVKFSCPYNAINYISSELYGLCFDSSTNGYIVIILSRRFGICVWVFDLKTLSWKDISDSSFSISDRENGVLVNGALHWIVTSKKCDSPVIVYFDLMVEKFKEVPKPDYGSKFVKFGLVDLSGWLCLYGWTDQTQVDIWAMKEYGKKESWTKLIVIPAKIGSNICFLKPLCLTKTGEVLVEINNSELAIYNPKECTFRTSICLKGVHSTMYVESLVLLYDGIDTTKVRHKKVNPNRVYRNRLKK